MQRLLNPVPQFHDASGRLIDGGNVYVGVAGQDPEPAPSTCFWDAALTIDAEQPLRTLGGYIVNGTTPANVFIDADDYSMRLADSSDVQVFYSRSVYVDTSAFQPRDSDLDAIAALTTNPFGRVIARTRRSGRPEGRNRLP
jgi:hypothetical protein